MAANEQFKDIINRAHTIVSVATDAIDGYATSEQASAAIQQRINMMQSSLNKIYEGAKNNA